MKDRAGETAVLARAETYALSFKAIGRLPDSEQPLAASLPGELQGVMLACKTAQTLRTTNSIEMKHD